MFLAVVIAVAFGLAAFEAFVQAQARSGGPFDLALLGTYVWVTAIAALGGVASFHRRVKSGQARWINVTELIGELVTSSVAGLLTYWMCRSADVNEWLAAAFIGIAGHMGSRALFMFEKFLDAKFGQQKSARVAEKNVGYPGDER